MGLNIFVSTLVWVMAAGFLLWKFRNPIARLVLRIPLPAWILFLLTGTFFSIVEENINCPPTGCALIPWTIPIFFAFLVIDLIILKLFRIKKFYVGVFILGIMGWITEFILVQSPILWSSPIITIVMTVWVILTYSIITIVPVTLWLERENRNSSGKKQR